MYDEWGIADGYHGVDGRWRYTPKATRDHLRASIGSPLPLVGGAQTVAAAPARCRDAPRGWGVAAQIYSLWRPDSWGIGDFADVSALAKAVAQHGGNSLLLSPLHAPTMTAPHDASPYYPSSRRWLNPMLLPMDGLASVKNAPGALIERARVWPAMRRELLKRFRRVASDAPWRGWAAEKGDDLQLFCTWTALAERLGPRWREWPEDYRRPDSPALAALRASDALFAEACEFHAWLQWLAERTLRAVTGTSPVALIADLAVGASPDGAESWQHQDLMAGNVSLGAPPDAFNPDGQYWGLPPYVPGRLRAAGYHPFVDIVRAALRGMSGLRIDHVMGLFRQFWIPEGASPAEGTYVQLPADDLLAIIRVEAAQANAFIIGEDLGNVEQSVRSALRDNAMLGTKVWWFDDNVNAWPERTLAMVTTHDLPTIAGVWKHADGTPEFFARMQNAAPGAALTPTAATLHRQIAASNATLCLATMEDLAGRSDRPNYPGTTSATHNNWCHRMNATSDKILASEPARSIIGAMASERQSSRSHV